MIVQIFNKDLTQDPMGFLENVLGSSCWLRLSQFLAAGSRERDLPEAAGREEVLRGPEMEEQQFAYWLNIFPYFNHALDSRAERVVGRESCRAGTY